MGRIGILKLFLLCAFTALISAGIYASIISKKTKIFYSFGNDQRNLQNHTDSPGDLRRRSGISSAITIPPRNEDETERYSEDSHETESNQRPLQWNSIGLDITLYEADHPHIDEIVKQQDRENWRPLFNNSNILLDPDKFLIPDLTFGPNNQSVGFMESAFVAIRLNRTLVLPSFHKHITDR